MKEGETVLVQGTGGVSLFALQLARMMGARVIATSSSGEKLQRARELGAVHGIMIGSREMFEEMNRAITQPELKPVVDRVFGFDDVREALKYLETGAHFGKVCVRM